MQERGDKKQLANGVRADIVDRFKLEASEITRRMQLAEKFTTAEELVDACSRCGGAWRRIIREELVKKPRKRAEKSFDDRLRVQFHRLAEVAGESDENRDKVVARCWDLLRTLGADEDDVEAEK